MKQRTMKEKEDSTKNNIKERKQEKEKRILKQK